MAKRKEESISASEVAKQIIQRYQCINEQNYLLVYEGFKDDLSFLFDEDRPLYVNTASDYLSYLFKKVNSQSEEFYLNHVWSLIKQIKSIDFNSSLIVIEKYLIHYVDTISSIGLLKIKLEKIDPLLEELKVSTKKYLTVIHKIHEKINKSIEIDYLHELSLLNRKYSDLYKDISKLDYQESIQSFLKKVIERLNSYDDVLLNKEIFASRFKALHSIDKNCYRKVLNDFLYQSKKIDFANFSSFLEVIKEITYENTEQDITSYHDSLFKAAYFSLQSSWSAQKITTCIVALNKIIADDKSENLAYYAKWYIQLFKLNSSSYSNEFDLNLNSNSLKEVMLLIRKHNMEEYIDILTKYVLFKASKFGDSCAEAIIELESIKDITEQIRINKTSSFNKVSTKIIEECTRCAEYNFPLIEEKLGAFLTHCKMYLPHKYEQFYVKLINNHLSYDELQSMSGIARAMKLASHCIAKLVEVNPTKYIQIINAQSQYISKLPFPKKSGVYFIFFKPFHDKFTLQDFEMLNNADIRNSVIKDATPYYSGYLMHLGLDKDMRKIISDTTIELTGEDYYEQEQLEET